jgi:hypothetical protein
MTELRDAGFGKRRFNPLQRSEFRRVERTVESAQPVRPLRMSDRRQMVEECGVMQEKRGHLEVRRGLGRI